ncbi:MAG: DUF3768 domain-containing protein [Anaerolineae bacterium]|nr:DUF3768 domain-containing protein [Anaerolineae bacterium]
MKQDTHTTARIAEINDQCRRQCMMPVFGTRVPCQIVMTQGMAALGPEAQIRIAAKVRDFDSFDTDNDPYGERDFGAFEHEGRRIFWKIDYYAPDMEHGSEDPADPQQTVRVLTIMLAEEY